MTDRTFKIYIGEDKSPVRDLTDEMVWEESEFGTRAWRGEATSSTAKFRDESGRFGDDANLPAGLGVIALPPRNVTQLVHGSNILWQGRIANVDFSRGDQKADRAREASIYLEDVNIDLRGVVVHSWDRPAETDVQRLQALVAHYLSGSPSETRNINGSNLVNAGSNTVNLPAKKYVKTTTAEVIADLAEAANKTYYLLPPRTTGTSYTAEIVYDGNDAVIERCPFKITDRPDEIQASPRFHFPPIWNVGPATSDTGQEVISGVWLFYGDDPDHYAHQEDVVSRNTKAHWEEIVYDDSITTEAEAHSKARAILSFRKFADRVINVTIGPLDDQQIGSIRAGQTISIKAYAIPHADDQYFDAKIGQFKFTTPVPGMYFAHLQLERPKRMGPYKKGTPPGPKQAESGGGQPFISDFADGQDDDGNQDIAVTVGTESNRVMYVATLLDEDPTIAWHPSYINAGTPGAGTSLTLVDSQVITGTHTIYLYRLVAPATSVETTSAVRLSKGAGVRAITGVWVVADADQSTPETDTSKSTGSGTTSSVTVTPGTNDLIIDVAGWAETNATVTTPAEAGDNTQDFARTYDRTFGLPDYAFGGAHGSDATPAWNFTNSHTWGALAWAVKTTNAGSTTQPVGGTGEGTVGDGDGTYVGPEHVHEHGNITTGGPYHMAEDVTIADAGGLITATTVEGALQELATGSGDLPWVNVLDHGADPTGVSDSLSAFNDALDTRTDRSAAVIVPPGVYRMTGPLVLGNSTVILGVGANMEEQDPGGGGSLLTYRPHSVLYFDNDTDGIVAPDDAAVTYRCHRPIVENVTIRGGGLAQGNRGVWLRDNASSTVSIQRVGLAEFRNCFLEYWGTPYDFDGTADSCKVIGGHIHDCDAGFVGGVSEDVFDRVCVWDLATGPAVFISGDRGQVIGCEIEPLVGSGIVVSGDFNRVVANDVKDITGTAIDVSGDNNVIVGNTGSRSISDYYNDTGTGNEWGHNTPTASFPAAASNHDDEDHSTVGHYELLMTGSSPPEPLEDGTGTDWLYVWVNP